MNYRRLGVSGLFVSEIALGSHLTYGTRLDLAESRACILRAFECGVNLFDTADGYGDGEAERILGRVLGELPRGDWVIATKCFFPVTPARTNRGLSRKHVIEAVDASLARLRTDHLDLLQCHRFDPETPLEETVVAMDDVVRSGKVLYWGMGRFSAEQMRAVAELCQSRDRVAPIAHQTSYSVLRRRAERDELRTAAESGAGTLAYAILEQGVLTGKYAGGVPPESRAADPELRRGMPACGPGTGAGRALDRLRGIAARRELPLAHIAIAWCLRRVEVSSVIVGATRPSQVEDSVKASGLVLAPDLLAEIDEATGTEDGL